MPFLPFEGKSTKVVQSNLSFVFLSSATLACAKITFSFFKPPFGNENRNPTKFIYKPLGVVSKGARIPPRTVICFVTHKGGEKKTKANKKCDRTYPERIIFLSHIILP